VTAPNKGAVARPALIAALLVLALGFVGRAYFARNANPINSGILDLSLYSSD
jgi:hypothetical protein